MSVTKLVKRLEVLKRSGHFDSFDPIWILSFLSAFKLACDTKGSHKRAAMWFLHCFMKKLAAAALNTRISLPSMLYKCYKGGTLSSCKEVVKYLLETSSTDEVIARIDTYIKRHIRQPLGETATEHA